jgi:hypothetical protein
MHPEDARLFIGRPTCGNSVAQRQVPSHCRTRAGQPFSATMLSEAPHLMGQICRYKYTIPSCFNFSSITSITQLSSKDHRNQQLLNQFEYYQQNDYQRKLHVRGCRLRIHWYVLLFLHSKHRILTIHSQASPQ